MTDLTDIPIIPKVVMERDLRKAEWEKLLRAFLSQHYCEFDSDQKCMRSRNNICSSCEWEEDQTGSIRPLKNDTAAFIPAECLPFGTVHDRSKKHASGRHPECASALLHSPNRRQVPSRHSDSSLSLGQKKTCTVNSPGQMGTK